MLAASGLVCTFWGVRLDRHFALDSNDRRFRLWMICSLFIAASAILSIPAIRTSLGGDVLLMLASNFAYYVSLPLLAVLVLSVGRNWPGSGRFWGRILLAPIIAFAAARQFHWGVQYTQLIAILAILLGLAATFALTEIRSRALLAASTAGLGVTLICSNPLGIWPILPAAMVSIVGALVLLLVTYAIQLQLQATKAQ